MFGRESSRWMLACSTSFSQSPDNVRLILTSLWQWACLPLPFYSVGGEQKDKRIVSFLFACFKKNKIFSVQSNSTVGSCRSTRLPGSGAARFAGAHGSQPLGGAKSPPVDSNMQQPPAQDREERRKTKYTFYSSSNLRPAAILGISEKWREIEIDGNSLTKGGQEALVQKRKKKG